MAGIAGVFYSFVFKQVSFFMGFVPGVKAFGAAVQVFGESGEKLGAHLERVDVALNAQMARSDEQLAYYVAQAREVIDLSILSQKQIIEELQRLAGRQAAEALA